jgi:hypothetical protein
MMKTHNALCSDAFSAPVEIHEVDGIALSAEEVNFAKLLIGKLARSAKGSVIDFNRASKRRFKASSSRKS